MAKPKNKKNNKKKSLKHTLTKHILKRIKRRAKVNGFNKQLRNQVSKSIEPILNEDHIYRNKQREAAFNEFKFNELNTENDLRMLPQLLNDPSIPRERQLALQSYYDALKSGQATVRDRDRYIGPIQKALINSVPYNGFANVNQHLQFLRNALPPALARRRP